MIRESGGSRLARFAPYALLVAVTATVYANTLTGGFVWDDRLFAANPVYWNFNFRTIFFSLANGLEYLPVRDLTYLFDQACWGGNPFGFHLTNLLLFIGDVLLFYRVSGLIHQRFVKVGDSDDSCFVPLLAALIFAIHPLRSEVVAWVTQRNTLMATLFFLLTIFFFLCYRANLRKGHLLLASGFFLLALLSKAIVVVLPLLLLLLILVDRETTCRRPDFRVLLPFVVIASAGAFLHMAIARRTAVITPEYFGSLAERAAVALQLPAHYLKKILLPVDLSAFYADQFALSLVSMPTLTGAAGLAAGAAIAWLLRRRFPELLLGGGWFLIMLLPVSNLFATSPVIADRYLFLPSCGLAFLVAALLGRLPLPRRWLAAVAALLLAALALLTCSRNRIWHDDLSLWTDTASRSPQVAAVWYNLGSARQKAAQPAAALEAYLRAVNLDPAHTQALDNAAGLFPAGRGNLAERHLLVRDLAGKLPSYPAGLALLGHTTAPWRHPDAAEELLLNLLAADRGSTELQLALANLYLAVGAVDRAAPIYREVVQAGQGKGEAEFGLAKIAAAAGNGQDAARLLALARSKGGVPEVLLRALER